VIGALSVDGATGARLVVLIAAAAAIAVGLGLILLHARRLPERPLERVWTVVPALFVVVLLVLTGMTLT
jgi:hypothetical protein